MGTAQGRGGHRKPHLPQKVCVTCGRPFTWRKKWERVWDEVKYCSDRCRREKRAATGGRTEAGAT